MKLRISTFVLACMGISGVAPLWADWRDDAGFTRLKLLASSDLPSAPSQGFTLVEASTTASPTFTFLPDTTNTLFTGKTFTNQSATTGTAVSFHATRVATNFYGNTSSLVTGNCPIDVYYVDDWLGSKFLNFKTSGSISLPRTESRAVENHSWVGSTGTTTLDTEILQRLDYAINRDGFVCAVGSDNNGSTTLPGLLIQSYNTISVGRDDGGHSAGFTTVNGNGRIKPDIVAPSANPEYATSWTTPMVSSAAGLLYAKLAAAPYSLLGADKPRVIKALLLASATKNATWANTSTRPLDLRYGAGILNINNAYNALRTGRATASNTAATTPRGWAAETVSGNSTKTYYFTVAAGAPSTPFSAALTWHPVVAKSGFNTWNSILANLNLYLYRASGFTLGTLVSESLSTVDNVELVYQSALVPGNYALVVQNASATSTAYALAWHSLPAVTVQATTSIARESNDQAGIITITRTGDTTLPLFVPLTVSGSAIAGTYYQTLPASVTIAAGQSSITLNVTPITDDIVQGDRTVIVAIAADSSLVRDPAQTATVTILDKPTPIEITAQPIDVTANEGGSAIFSVTATGTSPTYEWKKAGVAISGATGATLTLNNIQPADAANYTVVVTNAVSSVTSGVASLTVIPTAWPIFQAAESALTLEIASLVKLNSPDQLSVVTGAEAHGGVDALKFQTVDGGATYVERTIVGPSVVSFSWRVSSEQDFDLFQYSVDGSVRETISGDGAWLNRSLTLGAGTHTIRWTYSKDEADANFDDAGYLDDLVILESYTNLEVSSVGNVITGSSTLDFGTVPQNATEITQSLTLKNTGTISQSVGASLPTDGGFVFSNGLRTATLTLGAGQESTLSMKLQTLIAGQKTALLGITATGSRTTAPAITLTGLVEAPNPKISCSWSGGAITSGQNTAVDFGAAPSDLAITVNNTGSAALAIASVSVSSVSDFEVTSQSASTVAVNGSTKFTLRALDTNRGNHQATVTIASNDDDTPYFTFPLASKSYLAVAGTAGATGSFYNSGTTIGWDLATTTLASGSSGQAIKTGATPNSGDSTIGATFEGPGLLSWNWNVSAQQGYDWLLCEVNGAEVAGISTKTAAWQSQVVQIPVGSQVRWIYRKDATNSAGTDSGYLSDIRFSKFTATQTSFQDWSAAHGDLSPTQPIPAGGMQAMFAWLGGVDPATGPSAGQYQPSVSGGFYKYRYTIAKAAVGIVQPQISMDLVTWNSRKMIQTLISEDDTSAVVELSVPATGKVFSRLAAEMPAYAFGPDIAFISPISRNVSAAASTYAVQVITAGSWLLDIPATAVWVVASNPLTSVLTPGYTSNVVNDSEIVYGGTAQARIDSDGDGIADANEDLFIVQHINPLNTIMHTSKYVADTDGDGISDGDEIFQYHTDPTQFDRSGSGYAVIKLAKNATGLRRTAVITIAGIKHTITQDYR